MKKKRIAEPIIAPEILNLARQSIQPETSPIVKACAVCGASCTPLTGPQASDDNLCWVCRRLKISAWREADQQLSAQE